MSDVKVKISADTTELSTGLSRAQSEVSNFAVKTEMMSAKVSNAFSRLRASWGALAAGFATVAGLKSLIDEAGRINDLAARFGVSAESIQKIGFAAEQSGTDLETVVKALQKANNAATDALQGNEKLSEAFLVLGISPETFLGLSLDEQLVAISDGLIDSENKTLAVSAAFDLLGKSAGEMIPLLKQGGDAISETMTGAYTASDSAISRVDALGDKFAEFWTTLKSLGIEAIGLISKGFEDLHDSALWIVTFTASIGKGLSEAKNIANDTLKHSQEMREDEQEKGSKKEDAKAIAEAAKTAEEAEEVKEKTKKKRPVGKDAAKNALTPILEQAEAEEKANKEAEKEAEKRAKERAKAEIRAKQDALKSEMEKVRDSIGSENDILNNLENRKSSVSNDLARIGGGYGKSDLTGVQKQNQFLQKQIDLQKSQIDKLEKIHATLKDESDKLGKGVPGD